MAETVARATGVDGETARQTIIAGIGGFATGRFTTPEEVAALIAFLASDRAGNITGVNFLTRNPSIERSVVTRGKDPGWRRLFPENTSAGSRASMLGG